MAAGSVAGGAVAAVSVVGAGAVAAGSAVGVGSVVAAGAVSASVAGSGASTPGSRPLFCMIAAASSLGGCMRRAARDASRSPSRAVRYSTPPGGGVTMPSSTAAVRTRSPEDRRAMSASMSAFWRSSVAEVVTAREMPELSLSSETCMATIPPSRTPISQIQTRPRSRPSTTRVSGSARMRSKTPVVPRRTAGAGGRRAASGRTRDAAGRVRPRVRVRAAWRARAAAVSVASRAPP